MAAAVGVEGMFLMIGKMSTASISETGRSRIAVLLFFTIYLILGLVAYKDYGISWDEPSSRERGIRSLKYIMKGDPELINADWMYHHGAAFETSLVAVEAVLGLTRDLRSVYLTRHLLTFLLFYTSVVFFYFLGKRTLHSWQAGLLGCAFLVLSPRIFAHSFYNPKDVPFLSLFIISLYSMVVFLDRKRWLHATLHGVACALLIDVRVVGAAIPMLTLGLLGFDYLRAARKEGTAQAVTFGLGLSALGITALIWYMLPGSHLNNFLRGFTGIKSALANTFILVAIVLFFLLLRRLTLDKEGRAIVACATIFVISLVLFATLFWPALWPNPIGGLASSLDSTTSFPWPYSVLYMGKYTKASDLPWHYLPVWIGISTPIAYSALFLLGYFRIVISAISRPWRWFLHNRNDFIYLALITFAIGGAILFKPVLYDDWRQMYFIYPVFILIAVSGLWSVLPRWERPFRKPAWGVAMPIAFVCVGFSLIWTARTMVAMHPYQNVYFNRLAGASMDEIKSNYDLDYWGLSYRQALEYIAANDKNERITLHAANYPARANVNILEEKDRKRFIFVDSLKDATYFLGNFRYRDHKEEYPPGREYFSVELNGAKIVVVLKIGDDAI